MKAPDAASVVASYGLTLLSVVLLSLLANVTVVSQLQHFTAQHSLYDQLRLSLAEGSTPIGQLDAQGHLVARGTPIALLEIPDLGVKEVVVEGTASRQTKVGVGHRPDTPLPGQPGVSVLMGRAAAYGGVFGQLDRLAAGRTFTVTTGQGRSTYKVIGVRTGTVKLPALVGSAGRLTLVTAAGSPFLPHGVMRVDADLVSTAYPRPAVAFAGGVIDDAEQGLAGDPSRLFSLSWLLELLVVVAVGAVWVWKRWSHQAALVVVGPVVAAVGLACADRICDLLPNLM
jgi:LPXTG-site transpeptidase (sortase) family protein